MKIGIDTFGCEHARSGLGSYLLSLAAHLPETADVSYELFGAEIDRYTYCTERDLKYEPVHIHDNFSAQRIWHVFSANRFATRHSYDVVLYTAAAHMLPFSFNIPGVAVINDIMSGLLKSGRNPFAINQIRTGLKNVSRIIAASHYIRNDLVRLGVDALKIDVIYNGIDHSHFYPHPLGDNDIVTIKPFAIKRPYLIYASRMNGPSKKHIELIKAFTLFKERTHLPYRLVLAGSEGSYAAEIQKSIAKSSAVSDIFLTGYFPVESFPELYSGADACIFPSVSEGVGLPVLEAMATGIPVACARSGVLPEIAGDNALFFDADNTDEVAYCIERIVTDKGLREKLIAGGVDWAKRFQWEKTARMTLDVLRSTAE